MGKPSPAIMKFMETYKVDSDEIWEVRSGGAWAIKHAALERVAVQQNIVFLEPKPLEARGADKCAALIVYGKMGDRTEWATGEAAPANCKNAYPYAMAEKRGKDRVTLKLLNAHGLLYSEDEADDFAQPARRENPHVTRPEDIGEATEYDDQGQPVDNIPLGDRNITKLSKTLARKDFENATTEIRACKSLTHLQLWASNHANRVASYPPDWQEMMRGIYADHRDSLRKANGNGIRTQG
jgi:hypothetical protein